jgi:hypothetical protein
MPDRPVDLFADAGLVLDREAGVAGASLLGVDPAELDFGPDHAQGEIARDHVIIEDHGYYDGAGSGDVINTGDQPEPGDGEVVVEVPMGFPKQGYFFGEGAPPPYDLPQETGETVIKEAYFNDGAGSGDVINTGDQPEPADGEVAVEVPVGFPQQAYFFGEGAPPPYDLPQEVVHDDDPVGFDFELPA